MTNLNKLTALIVEAVPEIMELKDGCLVRCYSDKEILPPMERCVKSKRNEYRQEIINKAKNKWGINL